MNPTNSPALRDSTTAQSLRNRQGDLPKWKQALFAPTVFLLQHPLGAIVVDQSPILEGNPGRPQSLHSDTGVHDSEVGSRKLASFLYDRIFSSNPAGPASDPHPPVPR